MSAGLIVFAKSPLDDVKSRLSGVLSREERSELVSKLITRTIERTASPSEWQTHIAYTPDGRWFEQFGLSMFAQEGDDLGERMHNAMQRLFDEGFDRVVLVGTDIPALDADAVREAFSLLEEAELVLGPAMDGGYYLVGSTRPVGGIFKGIGWSGPDVLKQTLNRAEEAAISSRLCRRLRDLDTPEDLREYLKDSAHGSQ